MRYDGTEASPRVGDGWQEGGHRIHYCNVKWYRLQKQRRGKTSVVQRTSDWPSGEEEASQKKKAMDIIECGGIRSR